MNSLLYTATLCLAIGYFWSTKYNSKFVYYMFEGVLVMRPALILLYSLIMYCLECQRVPKHKQKALKDGDAHSQSLSDSDASGQMDGSYYSSAHKQVQAYRVN